MKGKALDIRYVARADVSPERERSALAECYRLILESYAAREATKSSGRDDSSTEGVLTGGNAE